VLGTFILDVLAGHWRYAHLSAMRIDGVAPDLLGLGGIVSEDSVRRGLRRIGQIDGARWLGGHLRQSWWEILTTAWILDVDTTIKPLYGRQEGATLGYNPQKPGCPSHALHTYWIATLCLDVETQPGNRSAAGYGLDGLWTLLDGLPKERLPHLIRGDCGYGQEKAMAEAQQRSLMYLFKLRRSKGVRGLVETIERTRETRWQDAGQGWQGTEASLRLTGWSKARRVAVLRRRLTQSCSPRARRQVANLWSLAGFELASCEVVDYEYQVLVTNLPYGVETLASLYRERGDAENPFDELKNQWGWGGFTTRRLETSQHAARLIVLVYNWSSLYGRLVSPGQHHEAITSRPRLLGGVAKQTEHAGQRRVAVRLLHAEAPELKLRISALAVWLHNLMQTAPQLGPTVLWHHIIARILAQNFGVMERDPPALPAPT
jgi:hypothetical protein